MKPIDYSQNIPASGDAMPPALPAKPCAAPQPHPHAAVETGIPPWSGPGMATPYRKVSLDIPAGVPVVQFDDAESAAAEQYRILRTNIRLHPGRPRVLAISSPMPG